jgi:ribosomal protein S18 acetylase RimI-like enzyme
MNPDDQTYTFRDATSEDIQFLKKLGRVSYGQFRETLGEAEWEKMRSGIDNENMWQALLSVSRGILCCNSESIVGMGFIIPRGNPTELFSADWSYIRMVGVDPAHKGKGIARQITEMCVQHARQLKEKTIALHTSEFMDAARHLYESLGFTRLKEIEPRFGKRYWIYTLSLSADIEPADR